MTVIYTQALALFSNLQVCCLNHVMYSSSVFRLHETQTELDDC